MEFNDGSDDEGDEQPAWKHCEGVTRTLWMHGMAADCQKKDKVYSQKFLRGNPALFPRLSNTKYSRQQKNVILAQFKHENVSRNIRRYVMKTVWRGNYVLCEKL